MEELSRNIRLCVYKFVYLHVYTRTYIYLSIYVKKSFSEDGLTIFVFTEFRLNTTTLSYGF